MSKFFDSEIVREELDEINDLQQDIYKCAFEFPSLSRQDKVEHIEKLMELLEKQKIMYMRLSLSEDSQAIEFKKQLEKSVVTLGFPSGTDMNVLFDTMKTTIDKMKDFVDK